MSKARTLKNIRKDAPEEDRNSEALAPAPSPPHKRGKDSRYVPYTLRPQTLEVLKARCGDLGTAAVEQAIWSSVNSWCMRETAYEPGRIAALSIHMEAVRRQTGYPTLSGHPLPSMKASSSDEAQAVSVAAEVRQAWEAAGCPGLVRSIEWTYQYVVACQREHLTPPIERTVA